MLDKQFIIERQGKQFVLYAGLLDMAHRDGLKRITTHLIQVPSEDNNQVAICSAEVETSKGIFSGIGDASPANVSRAMLTATIRLAETRAKARALRDAVNVGVAALEELGDDAEPTATIAPVVSVPTTEPTTPTVAATAGEPLATVKQVVMVYHCASRAGFTERQVDAKAESLYGHKPDQLTRKQASELIGKLKALPPTPGRAPLAPPQP